MEKVIKISVTFLLLVNASELMADFQTKITREAGCIDGHTYEKYAKGSQHVIRLVCNWPTNCSVIYGVQEYVKVNGKRVNINAGRRHQQYQLSGLMLFNQLATEYRSNNQD